MTPNDYRLMLLGAVTPRKRPTKIKRTYPAPEHMLVPQGGGSVNPTRPPLPVPQHTYAVGLSPSATFSSPLYYETFNELAELGMAPNNWDNVGGVKNYSVNRFPQSAIFNPSQEDMHVHHTVYCNDFANLDQYEFPLTLELGLNVQLGFLAPLVAGQGAYMRVETLDAFGDKNISVTSPLTLSGFLYIGGSDYKEVTDASLNSLISLSGLDTIEGIYFNLDVDANVLLPLAQLSIPIKITIVGGDGSTSSNYLTFSNYVGDAASLWAAVDHAPTGQSSAGFPVQGGKAYRKAYPWSTSVDPNVQVNSGLVGKFVLAGSSYVPYTGAPIPNYHWEDHKVNRDTGPRGYIETDSHARRKTLDYAVTLPFPTKPCSPKDFVATMWPASPVKLEEFYRADYRTYIMGEITPNPSDTPSSTAYLRNKNIFHRSSSYTKGEHSEPYELTEVYLKAYNPNLIGSTEYAITGQPMEALSDNGLKFGKLIQATIGGNYNGTYESRYSTIQAVEWMAQVSGTTIYEPNSPDPYPMAIEFNVGFNTLTPNGSSGVSVRITSAAGYEPDLYSRVDNGFTRGEIYGMEEDKTTVSIMADELNIIVRKEINLFNETNERDNPSNPETPDPEDTRPWVWVSGIEGFLDDIPPAMYDEALAMSTKLEYGYALDSGLAVQLMEKWEPILQAQQAQIRARVEIEEALRLTNMREEAMRQNAILMDTIFDLPKYTVTVQVQPNAMNDLRNAGKLAYNVATGVTTGISLIKGLQLLFTASLTGGASVALMGLTYFRAISLGKKIQNASDALDNLQNRGEPITIYLKSDETLERIRQQYPDYELQVEPYDRNQGKQSGMIR